MKYVGLKEFLAMPEGTLYMIEHNPKQPLCGIPESGISIKYSTSDRANDWVYADIADADLADNSADQLMIIDRSMADGSDVPLSGEAETQRYALYPKEGEIMFWVLTENDHENMIKLLQSALDLRRGKT